MIWTKREKANDERCVDGHRWTWKSMDIYRPRASSLVATSETLP